MKVSQREITLADFIWSQALVARQWVAAGSFCTGTRIVIALLTGAAGCDGQRPVDAAACAPHTPQEPDLTSLDGALGTDPPRGEARHWFTRREPSAVRDFRFAVGVYGALAASDIDDDGQTDLLAGGDGANAVVFRNKGAFDFEDGTEAARLSDVFGRSFAWGDLDNDGDLDLLASTRLLTRVFVNHSGRFTEQPPIDSPEASATHLLLLDYDNDGLLDVFASHPRKLSIHDRTGPNRLYRNLGGSAFEDVTEAMGIAPDGLSWAAAAWDYDDDGDQDIFVANDGGTVDFGGSPVQVVEQQLPYNVLLENRGGHFVDRAMDLGLAGPYSSMGAVIEDFDADGSFDIFIPDYGANKLLSLEAGVYQDRGEELGLAAPRRSNDACPGDSDSELCLMVSWGASFQDFDHDGNNELLLLNHEELSGAAQPVQLFVQDGASYSERSLGMPNLPAHALVTADFDQDGDLDWAASTVGEGLLLFENVAADGCDRNWLSVDLVGRVSNRHGIGATVEIQLDDGTAQRRIVGAGGVAHASLPTQVHFGLGGREALRVTITWPSGRTSVVRAVDRQSRVEVHE